MAKLTRAKQEIFGSTGATTEFGVFGSDSEGAAATTKDPALIQSLDTFKRGLYGATASATEPPRIQDINALYYLLSRQIAYGQQAGIPEWDATENYYANASAVIGSDGKVYVSKTGTDGSPNINNNPVSDAGTNWRHLWANTDFSPYPLSHLTRAMQINGDGVPTFPDNVAGRAYYRNKDWTVTTGWAGDTGTTLSIDSSMLKAVTTAGKTPLIYSISSTYQNKQIKVILQSDTPITSIYTVTGSSAYTAMSNLESLGGNRYSASIYWSRTGSDSFSILPNYPATSALTWYVEAIYIGSGLYDTPVYGKDGQTIATNYGVLPINGPRGKGLLFQGNGAMPLVCNGPVIGATGTIRFKFKSPATLIGGYYFGNATSSMGLALYQNVSGDTALKGFSIGKITASTEYTYSFYFSLTNLYVYRNGALQFEYTLATPLTISPSNLYIGSSSGSPDGQNFTLYDFEYVAEAETLDAHIRYHNGDDVVDSQQKSNSGTPHAMAVYGADGGLKAHGGATVWDSSNDSAIRTPDGRSKQRRAVFGMCGLVGSGLVISSLGIPDLCSLSATDVALIDTSSGLLRTYRWNGEAWAQVGTSLSLGVIGDSSLCALSETDIALMNTYSNTLRTYHWNGTTWSQTGNGLTINNVGTPALCALSATDVVLVGATDKTLRTYRWSGADWGQVGTGLSLTSVTTPALCTLNTTDIALLNSADSSLRVYRWNGANWAQLGNGLTISNLSSHAICALTETDVTFVEGYTEALRVYRWNGLNWKAVGYTSSIIGHTGAVALSKLSTTEIAFIENAADTLCVYAFN